MDNKMTEKGTTAQIPETPKVVLRTYRDTDLEQVEYLYRSTQVPLVYEIIRSKLWAFPTWIIWFAVYFALLLSVPKVTTAFIILPGWAMTLLKLFTTFAWAVVGFALLFISSDRIELLNRIDETMANDLKDPDLYYMNYKIDEDGKKVRKPENEQVISRFWVLTVDEEVFGMIGLSCNADDVEDDRKTLPVAWKQFAAAVLELLRLPVPGFLLKQRPNLTKDGKKHTFAHKQIPKTATITRWAVRSELQTCGFSTLLINRAITWAQEHDINRVYAMTNESCMAAEQILVKRHGFVIMKQFNHNFFGKYSKLYGCRVNEWMEKNGEKNSKAFKKSQ